MPSTPAVGDIGAGARVCGENRQGTGPRHGISAGALLRACAASSLNEESGIGTRGCARGLCCAAEVSGPFPVKPRLSERNPAEPSDERKRRRDGNGVDRETAAKLSSNPCPLRGYPLDERRPGSGRGWDRSRDRVPEASSTVGRPLHGGRTRVTGRQRLGHRVTREKNTLLDDDDDPPKRGAGVIRRLSETWETTRRKPHKTWVLVLENRIVWAASVGCSVPLTVPFRPQGGNGGRV
jgi:hypothetical protein